MLTGSLDKESTDADNVVCLGASAGGLEALQAFLGGLPATLNAAFVVVVHLSPDFKSLLPELLTKHTSMPVRAAVDGTRLESNHVYIITPGKNLVLSDGVLLLHQQDRTPGHGLNLPIDLFLNSLQTFHGRSIAVILSGTGSDGSRGIRVVKEAGGIVLAQTPDTARFDGMPMSALQTGLVDQQGSPEELAERVSALVQRELPPPFDASASLESLEKEQLDPFMPILDLLKQATGTSMTYLRPRMLHRRVERRMALIGATNLLSYEKTLRENKAEVIALSEDLFIGVTRFFRDPEAFDDLQEKALRSLVRSGEPGEGLRVWVAACSSGQEVYSLAMLILETMAQEGVKRDLKIFATDLDVNALERASRGVYSMSEVADIPLPLLSRYFEHRGSVYAVRADLRSKVIFAAHNLVTDPPFVRMDLVSCRNLLIYLHADARERALSTLFMGLRPDTGVLFLGSPETPGPIEPALTCLSSAAKVFRRNGHLPRSLPLRPGLKEPLSVIAAPHSTIGDATARSRLTLLRHVLEVTFESQGQSAALIDEHMRLVDVLTDPLSVFRLPKGQPTTDLARILSSELITAIHAGQQQLRSGENSATYVAPRIGSVEREDWSVQMHLLPSSPRSSSHTETVLLVLRSYSWESGAQTAEKIDATSADRVQRLELELRHTKESLQATIEELQSSSEEQQSTNEELIAANEELQSTNEELHSVNQELYTVNTEYQTKNQQLQILTSDLDNLLSSTEVATLYLDEKLAIRKFTPSIARVLPLQDSDLGRPISNIALSFDEQFLAEVISVRDSGECKEREVRDRGGAWLMMRVSPYVTPHENERGILVTFVDVTRIKNAEETAQVVSAHLVASNHLLSTQSKQMENLFSLIAKDLNSPLKSLQSALQLVERSARAGDLGGVNRHIASTRILGHNLERMLEDLGTISNVGGEAPEAKMIELSAWLDEAMEPFVERAKQQKVRLGWVSDNGKFCIMADTMAALLAHLLENALSHGSSRPLPRVDVSCHVEGERVRLSVSDNGVGIPLVDQRKVFDALRHLDRKSTEKPGIGLITSRRLAERMGGSLRLLSEPGHGSKFVLDVPLGDEEGVAAPRKKVLLVEDDSVDAKLVQRLIPDHDISWVRSLKEGMEAVDSERYSLVLLDLSLPDGHGLKLTNLLGPLNSNTPVVILSGQTEGLLRDTLQGAHVAGTFAKNELNVEDFKQAISAVLA